MTPEFSRSWLIRNLGGPKRVEIEANDAERAALARRFNIIAIDRLGAEASLSRSGETVAAEGIVRAAVTQRCVATGAPVAAEIQEPFRVLFRPTFVAATDDEIELGEEEMDVAFHDGSRIDLGEAVAETLVLALDPYPRAHAALVQAGVKCEGDEAGPFAALAAFRDKIKP